MEIVKHVQKKNHYLKIAHVKNAQRICPFSAKELVSLVQKRLQSSKTENVKLVQNKVLFSMMETANLALKIILFLKMKPVFLVQVKHHYTIKKVKIVKLVKKDIYIKLINTGV